MPKNTDEVIGIDKALCPYCGATQNDIDEDSSLYWDYRCKECGFEFDLVDIEEETTYYYTTKKLEITAEEQAALNEMLARKPIKGQIDIFGHEVGVNSEFS